MFSTSFYKFYANLEILSHWLEKICTISIRDNEAQARATAYIPVLWSKEIILEALGTPHRITKLTTSYCCDARKSLRNIFMLFWLLILRVESLRFKVLHISQNLHFIKVALNTARSKLSIEFSCSNFDLLKGFFIFQFRC